MAGSTLVAALAVGAPAFAGVATSQFELRYNGGPIQLDSDVGAVSVSKSISDSAGDSAFAAADLSSGELKAKTVTVDGGYSQVTTSFGDDATFSAPGATTGIFHLALHGSYSQTDWLAHSDSYFQVTVNEYVNGQDIGGPVATLNFDDPSTSCVGAACTLSTDQSSSLSFAITPGATVSVNATLFVDTLNGITGDFSHTASLSLQLPAGVTYTSDSGVFLATAASPSAVPEPAQGAMMLAGAGVLLAAARRQRRR